MSEVKKQEPEEKSLARSTEYELQERREQVQSLRIRGLSMRVIAKMLNVSPKTIERDLLAIRAQNESAVDASQQNQVVGEALARLRAVEERAWSEYHSSKKSHERLKALDLIRTLQNDQLKAFKDAGILSSGAEHTVEVTHTHRLDWSEEMKEKVSRALLQQSLTPHLAEPVPESEVIDATYTETENGSDDSQESE